MIYKPNFSLTSSLETLERLFSSSHRKQETSIENIAAQQEMTDDSQFISELLADKSKFDSYVYTPVKVAMGEMYNRDIDEKIGDFVSKISKPKLPQQNGEQKIIALFRNVATPNYEMHRFMVCADVISSCTPVIFEYTEDKYADINTLKYILGRMPFHKGLDKNAMPIIQNKTIIDMAFANGRRISELKTLWGEGFVEFHHEFLHERFPHLRDKHVDISSWLKESGSGAKDYYQKFFTLFLKDGILFENFLLDKKELNFTKEIVLPAIINIEKATGKKPLIVALEPTKHEGDKFWNSYPPNTIDFVNNKLK